MVFSSQSLILSVRDLLMVIVMHGAHCFTFEYIDVT